MAQGAQPPGHWTLQSKPYVECREQVCHTKLPRHAAAQGSLHEELCPKVARTSIESLARIVLLGQAAKCQPIYNRPKTVSCSDHKANASCRQHDHPHMLPSCPSTPFLSPDTFLSESVYYNRFVNKKPSKICRSVAILPSFRKSPAPNSHQIVSAFKDPGLRKQHSSPCQCWDMTGMSDGCLSTQVRTQRVALPAQVSEQQFISFLWGERPQKAATGLSSGPQGAAVATSL